MVPEVLVMSKASFDKLTPEDQEIVRQAAKDSVPFNREKWAEREKESEEKVRAAGVEIVEDIDKAPFIAAMGPVYEKYADHARAEVARRAHPGRPSDRPPAGAAAPADPFTRGGLIQCANACSGWRGCLAALSPAWRCGSPPSGMIAMTAMVAWQVFSRYVLNASPSWTEAASIMVMSWFIFLGAAVGVRENFHMGFDVLVHFLPESAAPVDARRSPTSRSSPSASAWWSTALQLTIQTWTATIPVLHLPGGFTYMPLVAGGVLITLFALERLALRARRGPGRPRPERRRQSP